MSQRLNALLNERGATWEEMIGLRDRLKRSGAEKLTPEEQGQWNRLERQLESLSEEIESENGGRPWSPSPTTINLSERTRGPADRAAEANPLKRERSPYLNDPTGALSGPLGREERVSDWAVSHGHIDPTEESLSLRKWLKGYATGDWSGAEPERRALAEGTLAAGGAMVPTPLSAGIIDLARNTGAIFQAGAKTVPMDSSTLKLARVTGDPTPAWHSENQVITPTDATFVQVMLTAQTLPVLTVVSRELLEDASGVEVELRNAFAQQIALKLDYTALYGTGTVPEPRGIVNTTGVTIQSMGANGAAPTNFDFLADAVGTLQDNNFSASAIVDAPRTERAFMKLKDTTNQPMEMPAPLASIPRFTTNQVPVNLVQGTATTASDAFVADFRELYVGIRTNFSIQVLSERYSDYGQVGLLGWLRADILVARPKAFVVVRGLI